MGKPVENLDADEVRQEPEPQPGLLGGCARRDAKRLAWMGKILGRNGVNVLIAAVARCRLPRRAREWCPKFVDVYVSCPLGSARARPQGPIRRAERGEINDIAGWISPTSTGQP